MTPQLRRQTFEKNSTAAREATMFRAPATPPLAGLDARAGGGGFAEQAEHVANAAAASWWATRHRHGHAEGCWRPTSRSRHEQGAVLVATARSCSTGLIWPIRPAWKENYPGAADALRRAPRSCYKLFVHQPVRLGRGCFRSKDTARVMRAWRSCSACQTRCSTRLCIAPEVARSTAGLRKASPRSSLRNEKSTSTGWIPQQAGAWGELGGTHRRRRAAKINAAAVRHGQSRSHLSEVERGEVPGFADCGICGEVANLYEAGCLTPLRPRLREV